MAAAGCCYFLTQSNGPRGPWLPRSQGGKARGRETRGAGESETLARSAQGALRNTHCPLPTGAAPIGCVRDSTWDMSSLFLWNTAWASGWTDLVQTTGKELGSLGRAAGLPPLAARRYFTTLRTAPLGPHCALAVVISAFSFAYKAALWWLV